MNKHSSSNESYIAGIDGLRAIAVLSVLIYHWNHLLLPGGFTGVDVFFVISGYVISKSLATSKAEKFSGYILWFYKRRFLRIVPALIFCLILSSIASVLFIPNAWLSASNALTAASAFFGVSNFYLVVAADGYFSQRIPFNPFVHTWSLAVEEQFYVIFPLVFYLWLKRDGSAGAQRALRTLLLPLLAVVSLVLAWHETAASYDRAFYLLPSRFWELAAGAILFQFQHRQLPGAGKRIGPRVLLALGAVLLTIGFIYADESRFPFPWALLPVVGTMLMIAGTERLATDGSGSRTLLELPAVTYIGRISYSLYLWHWPVFSLYRWTVGLEGTVQSLSAFALTFALSMFSYHYVENTFRKSALFSRQDSGRVVLIGLGSMLLFSILVTALFHIHRLGLSVTKDAYVWSPYYDTGKAAATPAPVLPDTGKRLLIVGDSHAGAYQAMARLSTASLGAETLTFNRSGCSIAKLIIVNTDTPHCHDFAQETLAWVQKNSHPGDILFLASLRVDRLGDQWILFDQDKVLDLAYSPARTEERKLALEQAAELVRNVQALGVHVMMDAPKPIFRAPTFRCADWFNRSNPICAPGFTVDRDLLLKLREPTMQSLATLHSTLGVTVWDPFPVLCDGPECAAYRDGKPMFMDGDHLSGYGNRLLVPSFTAQLQSIWRS